MCGIFGIVDFDKAPIDRVSLKGISDILSRRGPDEEGLFIKETGRVNVAFVHRRLSIIDLQAGKQPISNEKEDIVLVCNGEIYNYRDLREDLVAKGHIFKSQSDSEVIIHAYEEYSFDCLKYLRGMFAFAIWDSRSLLLFIARDRVGKKPLFYHISGSKKFIFASEIRALLRYGGIKNDIDRIALHQYLSYSFIPAPKTAFKDIYKLEPGHFYVFSTTNSNKKQYWTLNFSEKNFMTEEKAESEVRRLVEESVKLRMMSDVPLGAFVSGGLDSSIIAGLMSRFASAPIETYSMGFEEKGFSELPYARIVQSKFGCKHHEIIMRPASFDSLTKLVEHLGEPMADSSALATMLLAEEAKKSIKVALVGEGADELFAGYGRHIYYRIFNILRGLPFSEALLKYKYKSWLGGLRPSLINGLFTEDFRRSLKRADVDHELSGLFSSTRNFKDIDTALFLDTMFFLPYDLLIKLDAATMAYGLEARAPFLDHKLIEFAATLPPSLKLKLFRSKRLLRNAFRELVPPEILNRKKTGFVVPVHNWFRNPLKDGARDILLSSNAKKRGYFNIPAVENILKRHIANRGNFGHEIWALLIFEMWHNIFIDENH